MDNLIEAGFNTLEKIQEASDEELAGKLSLSETRINDLRAAINFLSPVVSGSEKEQADDAADADDNASKESE